VPSDVSSQFNVAFVQFQIAQTIITLSEKDRTLEEVEEATRGLASAIETLEQIAKSEAPPFPRNDITSRANMGRNTMAKQLERARDKQAAYEEENASKLDQARKIREADIRRREDEKKAAEEAARERRRKIIEDQERIAQRDRELMDKRGEEERRRMEEDEDREQRKAERKARGPKPKRKKKDADSDTEGAASDSDAAEPRSRRRRTTQSGTEGLSDEERPREKKKRKLARKNEPSGKFKSAEFVNDDDSDEPPAPADDALASDDEGAGVAAPRARKGRVVDDEEEEEEGGSAAPANGAMDEDEDE
jgi:RNA polymerase-associated protein CTR9